MPSGATINGVTVSVERKATNNEGSLLYARDSVLKLVKCGAVSGDNKAATTTNWPTSDASASYGGAADLWGLTLTDSDVNASDFGCVISATYKGAPMKSFCSPYVDHITITVTYTESGGGASAVPVIAHSYRQRRA